MEIEDRIERARTFTETVGSPITDDSFSEAIGVYLRHGGGDRDDRITTYVDLLADIGHMIGDEDDLISVGKRIHVNETAPDYADAAAVQNVLGRIQYEFEVLGASFDEALASAENHVSNERYEAAPAI